MKGGEGRREEPEARGWLRNVDVIWTIVKLPRDHDGHLAQADTEGRNSGGALITA